MGTFDVKLPSFPYYGLVSTWCCMLNIKIAMVHCYGMKLALPDNVGYAYVSLDHMKSPLLESYVIYTRIHTYIRDHQDFFKNYLYLLNVDIPSH